MRWESPLFLSLALALAACGDDGQSSDGDDADPASSCEVGVSFSGGYDGATEGGIGCGSPFGPDTGMLMIFLPGTAIGAIEVQVGEVTEGETGTFPATLRLRLDDERQWATPDDACSVTVAEHTYESEDDFSKAYQVVGQGTCAEAAVPFDGGAEATVAVSPFEFRFPAHW